MLDDLFSWPAPPTTVVNLRTHEYDVRIDRGTKWGNPFVIGRDGTREEVIAKFEQWLPQQDHLVRALHELRSRRLGCWCVPQACHGHVLARLADSC